MAEFTEKQKRGWYENAVPVLDRHGIHGHLTSPSWHVVWHDESRPGRGHTFDATYCDGEQFAQVWMDVYGSPSVSVALLRWVHADSDEESVCEDCDEREATDD